MESELGLVPAGWEVRPIGNVVETVGGGTPSTKNSDYWDDSNIVWFSPSDLTAAGTMFVSDSDKKINALGLQKSSAKLFPPYSVMMTSRATIGVTAINTQTACTNQGFITCLPNEALSEWYGWTDKEGQARSVGRDSPDAGNRRNDPDRNWGLGPE